MLITYDAEADCVYLYLKGGNDPGEVKRTFQADRDINLDFDKAGHLIGIELLSGGLLHPDLVKIAQRLYLADDL